MSLFYLLIIIPLLFFLGYLSVKAASVAQEEVISANAQTLNQIKINIDNQLSAAMQASAYLAGNTEFYSLIKSDSTDSWDQISETHRLQRLLDSIIMTSGDFKVRLFLDSNHMFTHDGRNIFSLSEAKNQPWYTPMMDGQSSSLWQSTYPVYSLLSNNIPSVSFVRMLRDPSNYNFILGFIVIDIPQATFQSILSNVVIPDQTYICLLDEIGTTISSSQTFETSAENQCLQYADRIPGAQKQGSFRDKNNIFLYSCLDNAEWYVTSIIRSSASPINILTSSVGSIIALVCFILVLFSGFVFIMIQLVAQSIQRKTNKILQQMDEAGINTLVIPADANNHFDVLENKVNALVMSVAELMERNYKEKLHTKDLELRLLQAQINPHFLYNLIDQIYWKAMLHNAPDVAQMLSSLAKYFRLSLHQGDSIIPLADEIELVKTYLNLQKIRFGMRFSAEITVDPEAENYFLPKMSLQPLVENALIHGVLKTPEKTGIITIKVEKEKNHINCIVQDNGAGMEPDTASRLIREQSSQPHSSGYGVYSVMQRLHLTFNEDCNFQIQSIVGEGTTVSFRTPLWTKRV